MKKLIIIAVVAALAIITATTVAFGDSSDRRMPSRSGAEASPIKKSLARVDQRLNQAKRVNCRTTRCFNNTLTKLKKDVKALQRDAFQCEQYVNVTRYNGYVYTPDGGTTVFPTTALDYTAQGDPVSNRVVVYTC